MPNACMVKNIVETERSSVNSTDYMSKVQNFPFLPLRTLQPRALLEAGMKQPK